MRTYCRAEMKFIDVTALADAAVTTDDNQSIGSVGLFADQTKQSDYGTFELNQFILDGSKSVLPENPNDIAFWSEALSKDGCTFETNPKITITFKEQHTSAAITLYFEDEPPADLKITWYTIAGTKLITETFYPDSLIYVCNTQGQNYGKIDIEFVRTSFPQRYIKLQYILYGKYIVWDKEMILTQEALFEERIGALAEMIVKEEGKKFIMIAGPSSSGKTTFSHRLSIQLAAKGLKPHPFPLDDYYVDRDKCPRDENGELDFECLESLDVELFNHDMNELLAGKAVNLPIFNFKTGKREYKDKIMQLGKDDVLVIEGIHGLNDKLSYSLPVESKFKIYISALTQLNIDEHNYLPTTDGRMIRRIVRDARTRGTSAKETIAMWDSVRRGEEKNIFPFQEGADVMFNSALIYELAVLKIYAEPLLFAIDKDCPEYLEAKRLLKFLDYFLPMSPDGIGQNSIIREFIGGSCFNV